MYSKQLFYVLSNCSTDNLDSVAYSGIYGTTQARGVYTINGVSTTFVLNTTIAPTGLFCSIGAGQTNLTYTQAGRYMEIVIGNTSTTNIVDRAIGDTLSMSLPAYSQGYGVSIVKLS